MSMRLVKRVLILDDDSASLDIMEQILTDEGFDIRTAEQADDIFLLIAEYKPDILIMDYILNGTNGGDLCRQIKANKATANLPVIIISAFTRIATSIYQCGCDDFIEKPFDIYDFVNRVTFLADKTSYSKQK